MKYYTPSMLLYYIFECNEPMQLIFIYGWLIFKWHDDVIKWKHFPRYWPFVRGIHWSPVNSPHKVQWRGALMLPLICAWINVWANNREAGDLRRYRAHYDVTVMSCIDLTTWQDTWTRIVAPAMVARRYALLWQKLWCFIAAIPFVYRVLCPNGS